MKSSRWVEERLGCTVEEEPAGADLVAGGFFVFLVMMMVMMMELDDPSKWERVKRV